MNHTDSKRGALIAAIAATTALVVSTGIASAAPKGIAGHATTSATSASHSKPAKKKPRPKPGLFVTAGGKVTTATRTSAYVVDPAQREHLVTLVPNATHAGMDTVEYYTRALGAKHWTVHAAPTLISAAKSPRLEEDVEWSDYVNDTSSNIEVVVYACDGIYAASADSTAHRLPEFTTVQTATTCSSPAGDSSSFSHLSAVFDDPNVGVQLATLASDQSVSGTWDLIAGTPGDTFASLLSLPTTDSFVPTQLTVPPGFASGITVVGHGVDKDGNKGIFLTTLTWTYNSALGYVPRWKTLKEIATLGQPDKNYVIESLTVSNNATDIGLFKAPGTSAGQTHTLFIDEGDSSNQWSGPIPLAHTTLHDKDLLLVHNAASGTLHAAYERTIASPKSARTAKSGILQQRLHTSWSKPLFLTHWYRDTPLQASVTTAGNIYVEYRQS